MIKSKNKKFDISGRCEEINIEKNARKSIKAKATPLSIAVIMATTLIRVRGALKFVNGLLLFALKYSIKNPIDEQAANGSMLNPPTINV